MHDLLLSNYCFHCQALLWVRSTSVIFVSMVDSYFSVSDRLSTGIAIADIDLSSVDSVREKMPIAKVIS